MMQKDSQYPAHERMTPTELRSALSLSAIYFIRLFGIFMIIPVFPLYASELSGATPFLVGVAIGIYGLTQALFQLPFGSLSDRFGRKPIITAGLLLFALGSGVAAWSASIWGVILGRSLQGAGAIGAAVMALAADLTREEQRTKAMALIGISIGVAFAGAFVIGPALEGWIGLRGLFWLAALFAVSAIAILYLKVPQPSHSSFHRECESEASQIIDVIKSADLLRLNAGILSLHLILTASFVILPVILRDQIGLASAHHWQVYLPVLGLSMLLIFPVVRRSDRQGRSKELFVGAVILLLAAEIGLYFGYRAQWLLYLMLLLFFTAFNYLEASLPALVSRVAPADRKGTALGVYSMSQFLGIFLGGAIGGWLYGRFGAPAVFLFCIAAGAAWLPLAWTMSRPRNLSSHLLHVGKLTPAEAAQLTARLASIAGVAEAVVAYEEGIAYLKIDSGELDHEALHEISSSRT
jgi:predicted MFS family arabinose efflux permease